MKKYAHHVKLIRICNNILDGYEKLILLKNHTIVIKQKEQITKIDFVTSKRDVSPGAVF